MKRWNILIVAILATLLVGNAVYKKSFEKTIAATYPLEKIELKKDLISIYISEKADLKQVVNLDVFKGANPQMTIEEVIEELGDPQDVSERYGTKFSVFYTENGRIESGNSTGEEYYTNILMFIKEDFSRDFLFSPAVRKYLPGNIKEKQIGIFHRGVCNYIINLSNKEEDWIQWEHDL